MRLFLSFFVLVVIALSAQEPYRLVSGDVIEFKYFYNPELNETVQIRPDGRVSFPLLGEIQLAGKTIAEATDELKKLYTPILKTPVVNMNVRQFAAQKVFVGGEVLRPGTVALPGAMTVFEAIAEAGGPKTTSNSTQIVLIRKGPDGAPVRQILTWKKDGQAVPEGQLSATAVALRPFDVLIVPESRISKADRWVDQHIRQIVPVNLTAGFSYLWNPITAIR